MRRFSLQALQRLLPDDFGSNENDSNQPSSSGKKSKHGSSGVFKEKDVGFSRMSFNTRLNNPPLKKQANAASELVDVPEEGNLTKYFIFFIFFLFGLNNKFIILFNYFTFILKKSQSNFYLDCILFIS